MDHPEISQDRCAAPTPWSRLDLGSPGWREDQAPEHNHTLPRSGGAYQLVALLCATLVAAAGLRLWLAPDVGAGEQLTGAPAAAGRP